MTLPDDRPHTWHYGLMARWWAAFNRVAPEELEFYKNIVERSGQPALDLGCGAGRLLLPLLRAGLDVDGCDLSPDMLAHCRELAADEGLAPALYQQAMHQLDLPRRYRTIYICDSFGIGGQRAHDVEALRRCRRQLAPGGTLVFNHYLPYDNGARWPFWLPEARAELPRPWPDDGIRRPLTHGDELEVYSRILDLDPLEQRLTLQTRLTLWRHGRPVTTEEYTLRENLYFYQELLSMVRDAGFTRIEVLGQYDGSALTPDGTMLIVVAHTGREAGPAAHARH